MADHLIDDKPHNPSAFPLPMAIGPSGDLYDASQTDPGMSLRDWFASQAMQAMITKSSGQDTTGGKRGVPLVAQYAYEYADAMLKARGQ